MKLLAVDQSYTCTGLAVVEDGQPVYWQAIHPKGATPAAKRNALIKSLSKFLETQSIDTIVIESQWGPAQSALSTSIIDWTFAIGLEIQALNARAWKKRMLERANAPKSESIQVAQEVTGARFTNDNIADAILIGVCAYQHPELLKKAE